MRMLSRRDFVWSSSLAAAGSILGVRGASARPIGVSPTHLALPAAAFIPEDVITPSTLRVFATRALDAARSAGAGYADVRVAEHQDFFTYIVGDSELPEGIYITPKFMYGIRVMVDGAWALVHGSVPHPDALATSARQAVATARGYVRLNGPRQDLAPVPVVTGVWETPMQLDPFTVPIGDQAALLSAYVRSAERVRHVSTSITTFRWIRETRVFASSEGSMLTQTLRRALPEFEIKGQIIQSNDPPTPRKLLWPASGGYECVTKPGLEEDIARSAEEVAALSRLPRGPLPVGRYPAIFDGTTLGMVLGRTLGVAVELDRALGEEAGAGGSSFLSPPQEMFGTTIANPVLNVTASRAMPSINAVKWDDEGVETQPFPLIQEGKIVNYCASRRTAPALDTRNNLRPTAKQLFGCVLAPDADQPALVRVPHLTIAANSSRASVEDLCKGISHGVLVQGAEHVSTDPQLSSGFMNEWSIHLFEIAHGKVVRRLDGNGLQFGTRRFWKSLRGVGDPSTVQPSAIRLHKGAPDVEAWYGSNAPAGFFEEADIISTRMNA